jgi:hypothetical protein
MEPADWVPACCGQHPYPVTFGILNGFIQLRSDVTPPGLKGSVTSGGKGRAPGRGSVSPTSNTNMTGPFGRSITMGVALGLIIRWYFFFHLVGGCYKVGARALHMNQEFVEARIKPEPADEFQKFAVCVT